MKTAITHTAARFFLMASSGMLLALAFPNHNLAWMGWVGLVPFLIAVPGMGAGQAFIAGWIAGIVYFIGVFPWITEVESAGKLAISLGYVYLGLYFGLFAALTRLVTGRFSLPLTAAAPVWVAVEYLRAHFFFLAFPWALLSHTQYLNLEIVQLASFTGSYGVSFVIVLVNGAAADLITERIHNKRGKAGPLLSRKYSPTLVSVLILLGLGGLWGLGHWSLCKDVTGKPLTIAVVQGNIPQGLKWKRGFETQIMSTYEYLSESAASSDPQLIVWPETATPGFVLKNMGLRNRMVAMIRHLGCHFLIGSAEYPKFGQAPVVREKSGNTALFFSPDGSVLGQYLKIRLLPLGEYIPYKDIIPWPRFILPPDKRNFLIPGRDPTLFDLNGIKFGVLICWENIFPELSGELVKRGADFLVNISNEAWFGKTAEPYQMLSMAVFRAVENRINMIRSTNTGISCFIDLCGRVSGVVKRGDEVLFVEGVSVRQIRLQPPGTFYTQYGDILAFACIALSLCLVLWSVLRAIRGVSSPETRSTEGNS